MRVKGIHGSQRGAAAVEYGIIVGLVSVVVIASVTLLGGNLSDTFCNASQSIGSDASCAQGTSAAGSGAGAGTGADSSNPGGALSLTSDNAGAVSDGAQAEPDPSGTIAFTTAVIEQDQRKRDLSARFNLGWTADDPAYDGNPDSLTVHVTWSPTLEVDQVITGDTGSWDYTLVEPGHLQLTRTGTLDEGGFNPEPEILLTKSNQYETVSVTFTAEAADTPAASETSSTVSNPRV